MFFKIPAIMRLRGFFFIIVYKDFWAVAVFLLRGVAGSIINFLLYFFKMAVEKRVSYLLFV